MVSFDELDGVGFGLGGFDGFDGFDGVIFVPYILFVKLNVFPFVSVNVNVEPGGKLLIISPLLISA
jgi:hypothetical protein